MSDTGHLEDKPNPQVPSSLPHGTCLRIYSGEYIHILGGVYTVAIAQRVHSAFPLLVDFHRNLRPVQSIVPTEMHTSQRVIVVLAGRILPREMEHIYTIENTMLMTIPRLLIAIIYP